MLPLNSWTLSDSPPPPPGPFESAARDPARHVTAAGHGVRAQQSARPPSEPVVFTRQCLEQTSAHKTSPHIWPRRVLPSVNHQLVLGFFVLDHFSFVFFFVCFFWSPDLVFARCVSQTLLSGAGTDEAVTLSCWAGDVSPWPRPGQDERFFVTTTSAEP